MKELTIVLLLISTLCNAQNFENATITYVVFQKPMDLTKLREEAKTSAKAQEVLWLFENTKDVKATLRFTSKESIYEVEDVLENDAERKVNLTYSRAGGNAKYYADELELFTASDRGGEYLRVVEEKKEWELLKDTKKIGKYNCYKAIQSNSVSKIKPIAWYAIELPLPFGPNKFNGLPGVILELELNNHIFKATNIILNRTDFDSIEKPTKGKKITYAEWRDRAKGFFENE